jgi:predicted dehydrogenase
MPSPTPLRVAFIGVGSMGQCAHLRNYATLPECRVVAIADPRQETARLVAARYAIPKVYPNHRALLAAEPVDALIASQPFTRHGQLIPDLLQAGVPVFTEKPLAGSLPVGEQLVQAVADSQTWLMLGYHKRSDPATMRAKAEIDRLQATGELGKLRYVRILMPAGDWIANGFSDLLNAGDKAAALTFDPPDPALTKADNDRYISFVNYYIHQVNLLRHLLGEPYRVTYADPAGILFAGTTASGVACTLEMSPYQTTRDWQESALVCFERGWIQLDLPAPLATHRPGRVTCFRDPGQGAEPQTIEPQLPWVHAMRQQAINFLAAVRGERPPLTTAAEALQDLQIARDYLRLKTGH